MSRVVVRGTSARIGHARAAYRLVSTIGGCGTILLGGVVAMIAGVVVCLIGVGVLVGACIESKVRRRLAHPSTIVALTLYDMTLNLGT